MKAAIIAAGAGERLRAGGLSQPKPLIPIGGRPLIDYVLAGIVAAGLRDVVSIVNEASHGIEAHCADHWPDLQFHFLRRTTRSSMESLFALSPLLSERFVLLTVDTVFAPATLRNFLVAADCRRAAAGVLALSSFVDDEKPLWTRLAPDGQITAFGAPAAGSGLVTAGIYVFEPVIFDEIEFACAAGFTALRQFLGHLLDRSYRLYGKRVGKTIDVDRPQDIDVAAAFVRSGFTA